MHQSPQNTQPTLSAAAGDQRFPFAVPAPALRAVVTGVAVLTEREDKTTRTNKAYARITLRNTTGVATLNVWSERLGMIDGIAVGAPVRLTCSRVAARDGAAEWQLDAIAALDPQHPVRRETMPACPVPRASLIARTTSILDAMSTEAREVYARILQTDVRRSDGSRAPLKAAYVDAPAALGHHHAYLGGLWHHSLQVTEGAVALASAYVAHDAPDVDLDAVRLGGLLHDLGKIDEYAWDTVIAMAPLSASMSHMGHGVRRITEAVLRAELCDGWAPTTRQRELLEHVHHIIASHHMQREWGAISEPASREAWFVQSADLVSSRVQPITDAVASIQDRGDGWMQVQDGWRKKHVFASPSGRATTAERDDEDGSSTHGPLLQLHVQLALPQTAADA